LSVERAVAEYRGARPVLIRGGGAALMAVPVDGLDDGRLAALAAVGGADARLVLTARRARWLGLEGAPASADVGARVYETAVLPGDDVAVLDRLAGGKKSAEADRVISPGGRLAEAAVELARIAHLAPSAVVVPVANGKVDDLAGFMLSVEAEAALSFAAEAAPELTIVAQARVPLKPDIPTRFVVFRGGMALHDQVAIVIGAPDPRGPVPVRLHSACLTGDLFGSLKCDCGDQLRNTVERFRELGGGVLLYLDQEGRGIGIANKMRAYSLQDEGFDTIDADAQLGFSDDERRYGEAARMLDILGYRRVLLHSNNPRKADALRRAGLDVVAREKVETPVTPENAGYLKTKALRAGHFIDADWVEEAVVAIRAERAAAE
jgi:GTP cyclohydrolase II